MTTAVFPGSFDPPTNGHLSIIKRASKLFDKIDVVIAVNSNKQYLFTEEERCRMMEEIIKPYKNVTLHLCSELVAQYAKKTGANVLLRGYPQHERFRIRIRSVADESHAEPRHRNAFYTDGAALRHRQIEFDKRARAVSRGYFVDGTADRRSGAERKIRPVNMPIHCRKKR